MTLLMGEAAIALLAANLSQEDATSSSHWRHYHQEFSFEDGRLLAFGGFGQYLPPQTGLRRLLHKMLQARFRRLGARFPAFAELDRIATAMTARQEKFYDLDVLRQTLSLALLKARLPDALAGTHPLVVVIGDGFASFSGLFLASFPAGQVILVNLTKTLLADLMFFRAAWPERTFALVSTAEEMEAAHRNPDIDLIAVRADDAPLLGGVRADLAVSIASMQEMDPAVVAAYFALLRQGGGGHTWLYCCNREEKVLPDATVVRFADYPWRPEDDLLIDELCPWHQEYYTLRWPFYRPYAGPHRHRLCRLAAVP